MRAPGREREGRPGGRPDRDVFGVASGTGWIAAHRIRPVAGGPLPATGTLEGPSRSLTRPYGASGTDSGDARRPKTRPGTKTGRRLGGAAYVRPGGQACPSAGSLASLLPAPGRPFYQLLSK